MRWIAIFIIGISLMFGVTVYASEGIISPLADSQPITVSLSSIPNVLGAQSSLANAVTKFLAISPTPTITVTPTPTPLPLRSTKKSSVTISLLGDSMVDTLGPDVGGLAKRLNTIYPATKFTIVNHGTGGVNIDTGLLHLTNSYSYLGATRPSVISQSPDVIVIESFGYNPYSFETGALTTHWLQMATVVNTIKERLPQTKIVFAATIAPNWDVFGDGAPFINMSAEGKKQKVTTIDSYIENTIKFARSEHYPLVDAYTPSRGSDGNGLITYINPGDHIHYSEAGRAFFAQKVTEAIVKNALLE